MTRKAQALTLSFVLLAAGARAATTPSLETTFAAAKHALQALRPAAFSDGKSEDQLLELLNDWDPNVRIAAAKALRDYATQDRKVADRLLEVMRNTGENPYVRKEAVKSLSLAAQTADDVRGALIDEARASSDNDVVRAIAAKALFATLYPGSPADDARGALLDLLTTNSERPAVRAGAAWGLFPDAQTGRTRDALLGAAQDQWLDAGARVEALRSLYFVLPQDDAASDAVRALADDGFTPLNVRVAAVLIHQGRREDAKTADWLSGLARSATPDQVRTAAIQAQAEVTPDLARFFHFTTLNRHWLDPLADE